MVRDKEKSIKILNNLHKNQLQLLKKIMLKLIDYVLSTALHQIILEIRCLVQILTLNILQKIMLDKRVKRNRKKLTKRD